MRLLRRVRPRAAGWTSASAACMSWGTPRAHMRRPAPRKRGPCCHATVFHSICHCGCTLGREPPVVLLEQRALAGPD